MSRSRLVRGMRQPQRVARARFAHRARHKPVLRRRTSAARSWREEVEFYALAHVLMPGSLLERIVAKRLHELGYRYHWQHVVDLPQLQEARCDFAVFGAGFYPFLDLEPDGELWHLDRAKDDLRTLQLGALGIVTIRLWETDLLESRERMEQVIDQALRGIQYPRPARSFRRAIQFNR